jgi:hypothetical protein
MKPTLVIPQYAAAARKARSRRHNRHVARINLRNDLWYAWNRIRDFFN